MGQTPRPEDRVGGLRPADRRDLRWLYLVDEGILDGLVATPAVQERFTAWDAQLGLSAKRRLVAVAQRTARKAPPGRRRARAMKVLADAEGTLNAALGPDFWTSGLLSRAAALVADRIETPLARPVVDRLAFGLLTRFLAPRARRRQTRHPRQPDPLSTAVEPTVGVIPPHWPIWLARERLDERERRAKGKQPEADRRALRRAGRALYECVLGRPPRPSISAMGRRYDAERGRPCLGPECGCRKAVRDDLATARRILGLTEGPQES